MNPYSVLGHEVLFEEDAASQCDVCGREVEEDGGEGHAIPGRALYVWTRGAGEGRQAERRGHAACAGLVARFRFA